MKWIETKTSLPETKNKECIIKVLVWFEPRNGQSSVQIAFFDGENFHVPASYTSEFEIHYWMPLPSAPNPYNTHDTRGGLLPPAEKYWQINTWNHGEK